MPATRFFPDAHLNVAENLLAGLGGRRAGHHQPRRDRPPRGVQRQRARAGRGRPGRGARGARRRARRPGGGLAPQPARGRDHHAGRGVARGRLLVVLARLRHARRPRPLRPDRARRPRRRGRLPLQRRRHRLPAAAGRDPSRPPQRPDDRRRARPLGIAGRRVQPDRAAGRHRRWDDLLDPHRDRAALRVPGAPLRPPLVRPLLLGDDRTAEVHRPPRRRRAADAPQGAPAPLRRPPRRPRPLLHDHRLDDVELAGVGAGLGRHDRALRRVTVRAPRRPPLRPRRRGGDQPARRLGQAHRQPGQGRPASRSTPTGCTACARSAPPARRCRPRASATSTST